MFWDFPILSVILSDFKVSQILSFQLRILNVYLLHWSYKETFQEMRVRQWRAWESKHLQIKQPSLCLLLEGENEHNPQKRHHWTVFLSSEHLHLICVSFSRTPSSINPKLTQRKPHCRPTGHTVFQFLHCTVPQERIPDILTKLAWS